MPLTKLAVEVHVFRRPIPENIEHGAGSGNVHKHDVLQEEIGYGIPAPRVFQSQILAIHEPKYALVG
jgi:hypothetical protein